MTKSTLFDRLNHELEAFGKKAQAALDEGKLQIELLRVRRRRDPPPAISGCWSIAGSGAARWSRGGSMRCCCGSMILRPRSARLERQIAEVTAERPSRPDHAVRGVARPETRDSRAAQ